MSIKNKAMFWLRNVNEYSAEPSDSSELYDGYRALSGLMKQIYEDYQAYEISAAEKVRTKIGIMADDLENYHNLTQTIDCLYQMAAVGVLCAEGSVSCLEIEKDIFKKAYKNSVTFPFQMLENYTKLATKPIFPIQIKQDDFFFMLREARKKQMEESFFAMPELPQDEHTMKQMLVNSVVDSPVFAVLAEMPRFKCLCSKLDILLKN